MDKNRYLIELSESGRTSFGRVDFAAQAPEQRIFSTIWALESEVNNGGFVHYFRSWGGDTAHFAPTALRAIGAFTCAELVERALSVVSPSSPLPVSDQARVALVESLSEESVESLAQLDSQFYLYPDDLTELLFAHVAAHPQVFGDVPGGASP